MWRNALKRAKAQCTVFPLCYGTNTRSSGLIRWPRSAVPNKPGNSRRLLSLSLPWAFLDRTGQLLSLSLFSVFLPYFHFMSITISLSLIPPSLQHWPTFQLTCLCKLPCAPVTKRGTKGKPNLYRTMLLFPLLLFGDHYLLPHLYTDTAMVFLTSRNRLRHWLQRGDY